MKKFLTDLLTFALFVAAICCFYFSATAVFASALLNFILFFSAIFLLIQGAGLVDKAKGFGKYCEPDSPTDTITTENTETEIEETIDNDN